LDREGGTIRRDVNIVAGDPHRVYGKYASILDPVAEGVTIESIKWLAEKRFVVTSSNLDCLEKPT
jgi:hypothetical protein